MLKKLMVTLILISVTSQATTNKSRKTERMKKNENRLTLQDAEAFMSKPASDNPVKFAMSSVVLFQHGKRQQAAFAFYIFQIRFRPWAQFDKQGSGDAALMGSLNDIAGRPVNEWIASDVNALKALATKAFEAEKRMPLFQGRPEGVDKALWNSTIESVREKQQQGFAATFDEILLNKGKDFEATRKSNGLYVGPWKDPGPEIPKAWYFN